MAENEVVVDNIDDGLTPAERVEFAELRGATINPTVEAPIEVPAEGAAAPVTDATNGAEKPPVADAAVADDDDGEDAPADPAAPVDPSKPPRRVRFNKFKAAEDRAVAAEAERDKLRDTQSRLDERLKVLYEAANTMDAAEKKPPVDADPEPDPEADIFAHNAWLKREIIRRDDRSTAAIAEMKQGSAAERADRDLYSSYQADIRSFKAKEPNYDAALQHVLLGRAMDIALIDLKKNLTVEGAQLTPQEAAYIHKRVGEEEKQLAAYALQSGQSPAQLVFTLAQMRGFQAPAAAATTNGAAAANGNGAAAPAANGAAPGSLAASAAAMVPAKPSVKDEIARVKNGQDAALSLSNGGGAPSNPLSLERLINMDSEEFGDMVDGMPAEKLRKLMEGLMGGQ